ncbi:MAG: response regulator [Actinoplanes sp.]
MATVLVVDDVAANRELVSILLSCHGHEVIEAADGADALVLAQSHNPDVVVSDVLMPGIDGLELAHRLRSLVGCPAAHAPVIFYTANYLEPETRPIAEACGVSQVVLRSADPRELLDAVDAALRNGPVEVDPRPADEFARVHARAVNAKLVEKDRQLRHSEQRFEAMATSSPVGIVLLDALGAADYVNPRLTEIIGMPTDRLLGHGWLACLEPGARDEALDLARHMPGDGAERRYRNRVIRPDGSIRWLRVHLRPIRDGEATSSGTVVVVDDVTDVVAAEERAGREIRRRQAEVRQRDAERLDSLRRMAGGMAHDFNNLLGAMLGFLHLAIETIGDEAAAGRLARDTANALLDDLDQVTKGGERATKLTEQLLAFGRREIGQPVVLDVNTFIRDAAAALADAAGPGVRLELSLTDGDPAVSIDPRPFERLLHILVHNAREAMSEGGVVTVGTTAQNGHVTVTVADTGRGMTAEVLGRAFEPFYSTKSSRTAGLGLATAQGVVTQAGGELALVSEVDGGTTASIRLPAAGVRALPTPPPPPVPAVPAPEPKPAGGRTILLVDDEDELREVTARFIAKAGYRVLTAAGGAEALQVAEQHADPIDCLVTDVVMPGMDGRQLAHRFLDRHPDTKVIFISGYAEALIDDQGRSLEPDRTILPKPFSSADLNRALRETLAAAPTG